MQVFSLYFKLLKKELPVIFLYTLFFLALAIGGMYVREDGYYVSFQPPKARIAWVNQDGQTELLNTLKAYLEESFEIIIDTDAMEEGTFYEWQQSLFYREIHAVITVPPGFTGQFINQEKGEILIEYAEGVSETTNIGQIVNRFLNTAFHYGERFNWKSMKEIAAHAQHDLENPVVVTLLSKRDGNRERRLTNYMNLAGYGILSLLMIGVGTVMLLFRKGDIRYRNRISPISSRGFDLQLLLADLVYMLLVLFGVFFILTMFFPDLEWDWKMGLYFVNALMFALCALAFSFLTGVAIKGKRNRNLAAVCIPLAMCFLCGVFIPPSSMNERVLKAGSFLPAFWYVKANESIGELSELSYPGVIETVICILIQGGFVAALVCAAMVMGKYIKIDREE